MNIIYIFVIILKKKVECKCYLDTSNFLMEYKERVENKINSPSINLDSIKFDFN
jgi:hypothetical protein